MNVTDDKPRFVWEKATDEKGDCWHEELCVAGRWESWTKMKHHSQT